MIRKENVLPAKPVRKEIEKRDQYFGAILEQSAVGVAIFEGVEMTISFANDRMMELWGSGVNVIGKTILQLAPEIRTQPWGKSVAEFSSSETSNILRESKSFLIRNGKSDNSYFNFIVQPFLADNIIQGITLFAIEVTGSAPGKQQVEEREVQFKTVLLDSPSIFAILRGYPEMIISFVNEPLLKSWSRTWDIVGKPLLDVLPELKGQPFPKLLESVFKTGKAYHGMEEKAVLVKDDRSFDVYYNYVYQPIFENGNTVTGITIMANDITDQVLARKAVEEQNRLLVEKKRLLELVASGHSLKDCLNALSDSVWRLLPGVRACISLANEKRTAIRESFALYLSPSFVSAHRGSPVDHIPAGTCAWAIQTSQPVSCTDIANDDHWSLEWRTLCLSHNIAAGHSTPIFGSDGKAIGSLLLCLDHPRSLTENEKSVAEFGAHICSIVLERDRMYSELHRTETQLEAELADAKLLQGLSMELITEEREQELYEKIMDGAVAIMHSEYGSMQLLYPERGESGELRLLAFRGFNPEAARFWEWVRPASESTCGAALRSGQRVIVPDVEKCEFMAGTSDLEAYLNTGIHAVQTTPLFSRSGQMLGMISTHWREPHEPSNRDLHLLDILARQAADLIERKSLITHLEQRVEERTKELQRSNEDLQQFAHVASHDLKEPVRKVKTFANRLNDELIRGSTERTKLYVEKILKSADRMSTMIDGVLAYSTFNVYEQKIQDLDLNEILRHIEEDLEIAIHQKGAVIKTSKLPNIEGVYALIYQLFYNLINNSLKFSKKGEKLIIAITSDTFSLEERSYARLVFADNGIGFDPQYSKKIFETFTRLNAKDKYEGTGLGLSMCKKVVERHHGTIDADGQDERGAVFTIMLPIRQDQPEMSPL